MKLVNLEALDKKILGLIRWFLEKASSTVGCFGVNGLQSPKSSPNSHRVAYQRYLTSIHTPYYFQRPALGLTDKILTQTFPQVGVEPPVVVAPVPPSRANPIPPPLARSVTTPALTEPTTWPFVLPPSAPIASPPVVPDPFVPVPVTLPTRRDLPRGPTPGPSAGEDSRLDKLRTVVRFGLFIAKADGHVAHAERKVLRDYLDQQFGHDGKLAWRIDPMIEAEAKQVTYEAEILNEVKAATTSDERQQLFTLAERIAGARGQRNSREKEKLAHIAVAFGLPSQLHEPPKVEVLQPTIQVQTPLIMKFHEPMPPTPKPSSYEPTGPNDLIGRPRAYVRLAVAAALSCGHFGPAERAIVREFLARNGRRSADAIAQFNYAIDLAVEDATKLHIAADTVRPMTSYSEKLELFELVGRIVDATGTRSPKGNEALAEVGAIFGFDSPLSRLSRIITQVPLTSQPSPLPLVITTRPPVVTAPIDPRTVLELPLRAELSVDLIRRRFAVLTDKLDPAKAAALGPEFAAMAERKLAELRAAAEALIAPFGEPLDSPSAPPAPTDLRHNPDLDDAFGG